MNVLDLVLVQGADSLVAGMVIGSVVFPRRLVVGLVATFGICDGFASGLAPLLGWGSPGVTEVAVWVACAGVLAAALRRHRGWLFLLPLLLSLDNLCGAANAASPLGAGLCSAAMAGFGIGLGALGRGTAQGLSGGQGHA